MAKHTLDDRKSSIHSPKRSLLRRLPYMAAAGLAELALLAGLASCNPTPSVTPTSTEKPAITSTYTPEAPTYTPSPTLAPITLAPFSTQLEGVGSNGTMACFTYNGDAADLDNLTLAANISQGGTRVESDIPAEQIDGKTCFELVDAKYVSVSPTDGTLVIPEGSVTLQLNATSPDGRQVLNNNQTLDLGKYMQFPFLTWPFPMKKICGIGEYNDGHTAWDFAPQPNSTYPGLVNIPILSPENGRILYILVVGRGATSIMLYSPTTGYLHYMKHSGDIGYVDGKAVPLDQLVGHEFNAGDQISTIGLVDPSYVSPHLHWSMTPSQDLIQIALEGKGESIVNVDIGAISTAKWVDYAASDLFLDSTIVNYIYSAGGCDSVPWGTPEMPPQQLPITIDGKANDWAGYTPVLTDASGDSQTGNVMDFTELYMAKDDNYLYFMVKLGTPPAIQNLYSIFLDTNAENQCGAADKLIQVFPLDPTGFPYGSLSGCGEGTDTKQYSGGSFVMGQVFEGKIPLLYLGELDHLEIVKIIGNTYDGSTIASPDTMP